jgi:uncharacterized membrane protein (UPF0127 family)
MRLRFFPALLAILVLGSLVGFGVGNGTIVSVARAEVGVFEELAIEAKSGRHAFSVEVMRTEADRSRGMMFRRSLDPDKGMLFDQGGEGIATFWMKNTYVSLDIIFIRADGTIQRIEHAAEPLSTTPIASGGPVTGVLELLAGTAKRLDIKPGDRVIHPLFAAP